MALDLNPQAAQMADESMVRTLANQTAAIWPQELLMGIPSVDGAGGVGRGSGLALGNGSCRTADPLSD